MSKPPVISALFLVAGTCIGGGMLALPVATAIVGFVPSVVAMICAWLAMTISGLLFVEVGFWMRKGDAHVITMASQLLGAWGRRVSWALFLFVSYASLIAYVAGCGHIVRHWFGWELGWSCVGIGVLLGAVLWCSHRVLGRINSVLFVAMIAVYVALVVWCAPYVHIDYLARGEWVGVWGTLPLLLTSFSCQTMIPSLHPYLQHDKRALRTAVVGGTTLAFVVYFVWQAIVHGIVPHEGTGGLQEAWALGDPATHLLGVHVGSSWIEWLAALFAFGALVTSFLGIALGLYDFLSDGLKISKRGWGNVELALLVLLPTLVGAIWIERVFLTALDMSGGFGDTILNGMIPVLMVVMGRYVLHKERSPGYVRGGRWLLALVGLFFLGCLVVETLSL